MAKKKRPTAAERDLKSEIKKLQAKLERAEGKVASAKAKARRAEKAATDERGKTKKLTKRLDKLAGATAAEPTATIGSTQVPPTPDASWTVVRLRDEARARGLTGFSGKTKAQLLGLLT